MKMDRRMRTLVHVLGPKNFYGGPNGSIQFSCYVEERAAKRLEASLTCDSEARRLRTRGRNGCLWAFTIGRSPSKHGRRLSAANVSIRYHRTGKMVVTGMGTAGYLESVCAIIAEGQVTGPITKSCQKQRAMSVADVGTSRMKRLRRILLMLCSKASTLAELLEDTKLGTLKGDVRMLANYGMIEVAGSVKTGRVGRPAHIYTVTRAGAMQFVRLTAGVSD